MRLISLLFFILYFLALSIDADAKVPEAQTSLDINAVSPVTPESAVTKEQIQAMIPTDMQSGTPESEVEKKILDRSLKYALKSRFKNSSLAKTAQNLKEGLNTEASIGSTNDPHAIQHKFRFQYDAFQTTAKIKYSGFFDSTTTIESGNVKFEINEKIADSYQINISHQTQDDLSLIELKFNW